MGSDRAVTLHKRRRNPLRHNRVGGRLPLVPSQSPHGYTLDEPRTSESLNFSFRLIQPVLTCCFAGFRGRVSGVV